MYRAEKILTKTDVALKKIAKKPLKKKRGVNTENYAELLKSEVNILQVTAHPNLMQVIELLETPDNYYLATELCMGGVLFDRLQKVGKFNEIDAAYIIM